MMSLGWPRVAHGPYPLPRLFLKPLPLLYVEFTLGVGHLGHPLYLLNIYKEIEVAQGVAHTWPGGRGWASFSLQQPIY